MHNAAEQLAGEYAASVQEAHFAVAGSNHSSQETRRITADKFRSLKARLSSGIANPPEAIPASAPGIHIPDLLLKVRSARQAGSSDVWAELETRLPARSSAVAEAQPELPTLSEPEPNGIAALPERLLATSDAEPPVQTEIPAADALVSTAESPIGLEPSPEAVETEYPASEPPAAALPAENLVAEFQEQPQQDEIAEEINTATVLVPAVQAASTGETATDKSPAEPEQLYDSLSERLGSHVSILRKPAAPEDAFDISLIPQTSIPTLPSNSSLASIPTLASVELKDKDVVASSPARASVEGETGVAVEPPASAAETDAQAGEMARSLLDIMSAPSGATQPQERALAADMLLRLVPRIPLRPMIALVDRICVMEPPPPLLVTRLIKDKRPEIAGPILERCAYIADQDLMEVIAEGDIVKQRMIARRRHLSAAISDLLVERGDPSVLLTLVRNPGASISHDAFYRLCLHAKDHPSLQAPLTTRTDTPAPVAFELFWLLPVELRRYVLSRFLTDSETLNKLLKMASAVGTADNGDNGEAKFPEKKKVDRLVEFIERNETADAVALMEEIADVHEFTARRILADADGEPLTVVFKAIGMTRAGFAEAIARIIASPQTKLRQNRNAADLQSIFDSLSFNKARVLLTYWDWASDETSNTAQSHP